MNTRRYISSLLDSVDYIDMHVHMEETSPGDVHTSILHFANAVDEESYGKTLALAAKARSVIPMFGIHPVRAPQHEMTAERLESLILQNDFVGEIGLDYFWIEDTGTYAKQREVFETQLAIVGKHGKIPSIHTKGAEDEVLRMLREHRITNAIIHWYSGPETLIDGYLDAGCSFTVGPDIFTGSRVYARLPAERIFAETDNPTGVPWVLGGEPHGDDIMKIYRELSSRSGIAERTLIEIIKQNLRDLMSR
ncbi:MAG: TatD family hydrolase [Spirochaetales bacterium]|nr:TatD family hydrolase [Spirochaetales bacterium]